MPGSNVPTLLSQYYKTCEKEILNQFHYGESSQNEY